MTTDKKIKILGIAGSLRAGSYSRALLENAKILAPEQLEIESFDLNNIPVFNQDFENSMTDEVKKFKEKIEQADAILLVTPEYNYSFSGILKNAIDIASRPYGRNSWEGKPVAIISSTPGILGGSRAQYQLRQVLVAVNMYPLNRPEVMIPAVNEKFDNDFNLTDDRTKEAIAKQLAALADWTKKLAA